MAVVLTLTLLARYSGFVISCRQLSIRFDRPVEQSGEHHGGAAGCLASGESGSIRAGATDGGGEISRVVLQPLASSISHSSSGISSRSLFLSMYPRFLLRLSASLFFCSSTALTQHLSQAIAAVSLSGYC